MNMEHGVSLWPLQHSNTTIMHDSLPIYVFFIFLLDDHLTHRRHLHNQPCEKPWFSSHAHRSYATST